MSRVPLLLLLVVLFMPSAAAQAPGDGLLERMTSIFDSLYGKLLVFAGAAAVLAMAIAGLIAMASAGNQERRSRAMSFLGYAALGFSIVLFAPAIVATLQGLA